MSLIVENHFDVCHWMRFRFELQVVVDKTIFGTFAQELGFEAGLAIVHVDLEMGCFKNGNPCLKS